MTIVVDIRPIASTWFDEARLVTVDGEYAGMVYKNRQGFWTVSGMPDVACMDYKVAIEHLVSRHVGA